MTWTTRIGLAANAAPPAQKIAPIAAIVIIVTYSSHPKGVQLLLSSAA